MLKLYLMASNGYLPTLVFSPEQGLNKIPKDSQRLLPNFEPREDVIRSSPLNMGTRQNAEPWKPTSGLFDNNCFVTINPTVIKPALIDIQDCCPKSTLFSFQFPVSGLIEVERDGRDLLSLSDLTGLQTVTTDYKPYIPDMGLAESQLVFPNLEIDSPKPLMDFVGDLVRHSEITFHEDGQISLTGTRTQMKDILSVLAEFYLSKNSTNWRKQSVVPQFNRLDYETSYYGSALELENVIVAPPKSPEKIKHKTSQKKKGSRNKTSIRQRSNYSQACESLLSIIVDKNRNVAAIPTLKKSGPELPNLLTQFSASIAGTGIAVLFSVMCKVASGRVPFCSSKLLNTGLGLGLVWLSWAVNRLRDTIVMINKNSNKKKGLKDEEMMKNLDRSVKDIYFRAATLMAVMVLRLA
uniref:uncharacterized protein LOC122581183 n=1 Tax=Erigeron canadensis TaxID=72917 RepID=UPI001CB933EA|nr:uncharacterized protein LOC122581183 [Erigeron canadensis]